MGSCQVLAQGASSHQGPPSVRSNATSRTDQYLVYCSQSVSKLGAGGLEPALYCYLPSRGPPSPLTSRATSAAQNPGVGSGRLHSSQVVVSEPQAGRWPFA